MAFTATSPVLTKIVQDSPIEHVPNFKCPGCSITYQENTEIESKLDLFQSICGRRPILKCLKKKMGREI